MAEALGLYVGIVASIGSIIQFSEIVLGYVRNTAGANEEKKALLLEISATNILLKELEGKAKAPEWKKTLESMQKLDGPLEIYRSALKSAEEKLQPSKNPFAKVTKRLVWHFQKGEFAPILSKINRSKSDFSILLNFNLGEDLIAEIKESYAKVVTSLNELEQTVRQPVTDEHRKVLNWISKRNYWTNQVDYFARAEDGTGQWLLDSPEFKSWIEGGKRFLWCQGGPGVGKTILSSIVVNHLEKNFEGVNDVALACVYFNYKEATTPTDIIGNLLKQLLERNPGLSNEARGLYSSHKPRQTQPNLKELLQLLRTESARISTFFIVLDALDEFSDTSNARTKILLELRQIPNARVMITGRSHVGNTVQSKLDDLSTLPIRASNDDIRKYLNTRIEKSLDLYEMMKADQGFRATVMDGIVSKADGMFLVAALHVEFLEDQPNEHYIRCALDRLPKGLDETYDAAVSRIRAQPNPENVKLALRTLKWVTFAREHLQEKALLHALAVQDDGADIEESDLPNIKKVMSLCVGLVVLDQGSGKIRPVHETTQQYFQKYFRDVQKEDVDAEIAKTCLRYFSFPGFFHPFREKVSIEEHLEKYKLSSYTSRYWFVHIREGRLEEKFCEAIVKTLENQGTRDSIHQLREYCINDWYYPFQSPRGVHLLHLASMHGLRILCGELLRQSNTMQRIKMSLAKMHLKVPTIIEKKDKDGWTPLHWAARHGHVDVVRLLLEKGANVNAQEKDGWTPLHGAAKEGHADVVRLLLEKGANVNAQHRYGWTPLRVAAGHEHVDMVRLLLEKGANVNALEQHSWSPLRWAVWHVDVDVVRLLLEKGANVNVPDEYSYTALHWAIWRVDVAVVRLLLEKGANGNAPDEHSGTPLHWAVWLGHIDVVRLLLEKGANVNAQDKDIWTPLHFATRNGHVDVARLLLEKGANVNAPDEDRWTPLHLTAKYECLDMVRLLLEKGTNVNAQDKDSWTPLHRAASNGHVDVVRLLLEKGANVNAQEKDGWTPLHLAAKEGHVDVVRLLLEKGATVQLQNQKGLCPLDVAREGYVTISDKSTGEDRERSEGCAKSVRILEGWKPSAT